ncbi:MAG: NUDIX hydrolase [Planctomycetes bacterium]|nr:NUDIX hydrolase [Planctomycetota bacterium]
MHRRPLIELLQRYERFWQAAEERALAARFRAFAAAHADCLLRSCVPGHITASCWILAADDSRALLTHHRKLERWLQLGGHVDGEAAVERAALREAREESGMTDFEFVPFGDGGLVPLDLDVHPIPARGSEPRHDHWDVRFLLRARPGQALAISDESNDLQWFAAAAIPAVTREPSVLRLLQKSARLLAGGVAGRAVGPGAM